MCTAVTYQTKDFYFGRTLDYEHGWGEEVTAMPRNFPLPFRHGESLDKHYAIIGMARVENNYPLYFDGVNEKGLAMAGLNFVGNAVYGKPEAGKDNIAQFELIPWILAQCSSVRETRKLLEAIHITDTPFRESLPAAQLHWLIADREEAITLEAVGEGLRIYGNPVGVLTNNPPFAMQMFHLNNYLNLTPEEPENRFSSQIGLKPHSRGMGALGLPGDFSSQSRFVRAAFVKLNSVSGDPEGQTVSQFFHILDSVAQPRGCCHLGQGKYETTLYSSCCNATRGIYYYTTYENHQISSVHLHRTNLDGNRLQRYPLIQEEQMRNQN